MAMYSSSDVSVSIQQAREDINLKEAVVHLFTITSFIGCVLRFTCNVQSSSVKSSYIIFINVRLLSHTAYQGARNL